jgi:hypothetical protein
LLCVGDCKQTNHETKQLTIRKRKRESLYKEKLQKSAGGSNGRKNKLASGNNTRKEKQIDEEKDKIINKPRRKRYRSRNCNEGRTNGAGTWQQSKTS